MVYAVTEVATAKATAAIAQEQQQDLAGSECKAARARYMAAIVSQWVELGCQVRPGSIDLLHLTVRGFFLISESPGCAANT